MLSAAPNSSSKERLREHPGQVGRKRWGRAGRRPCCRDGSVSAAGGGKGQRGRVGKLDLMETPPRAGWWGGGAGWMRCAREDQGVALGWQPSTRALERVVWGTTALTQQGLVWGGRSGAGSCLHKSGGIGGHWG